MRTNQTHQIENNGQSLGTSVFGRSVEMNIKLIRNAMFITVIILVISVMGKTSAHEANSARLMYDGGSVLMLVR